MIDVRVAQEYGVDVPWVREPPIPIPRPQLFQPLEQAAVEQDPPVAYGDEVHRACDCSRCTEELQSRRHAGTCWLKARRARWRFVAHLSRLVAGCSADDVSRCNVWESGEGSCAFADVRMDVHLWSL